MTPEQELFRNVILSAVQDIAKGRDEKDAISYINGPVFERHVMLSGLPADTVGVLRETVLYSEAARKKSFGLLFDVLEGEVKKAPGVRGLGSIHVRSTD